MISCRLIYRREATLVRGLRRDWRTVLTRPAELFSIWIASISKNILPNLFMIFLSRQTTRAVLDWTRTQGVLIWPFDRKGKGSDNLGKEKIHSVKNNLQDSLPCIPCQRIDSSPEKKGSIGKRKMKDQCSLVSIPSRKLIERKWVWITLRSLEISNRSSKRKAKMWNVYRSSSRG